MFLLWGVTITTLFNSVVVVPGLVRAISGLCYCNVLPYCLVVILNGLVLRVISGLCYCNVFPYCLVVILKCKMPKIKILQPPLHPSSELYFFKYIIKTYGIGTLGNSMITVATTYLFLCL
jgi:hypothetical protein